MAKKYNTNRIKETLNYSINDIAQLFGLHKRTVQHWIKEGLEKIDNRKPFLVLGKDLKGFLKEKQGKRKKKCKENEIYCCKCREARRSWENLVDIRIINKKMLLIVGICDQCGKGINRLAGINNIPKIKKLFMVQEIHNKDLIGLS